MYSLPIKVYYAKPTKIVAPVLSVIFIFNSGLAIYLDPSITTTGIISILILVSMMIGFIFGTIDILTLLVVIDPYEITVTKIGITVSYPLSDITARKNIPYHSNKISYRNFHKYVYTLQNGRKIRIHNHMLGGADADSFICDHLNKKP